MLSHKKKKDINYLFTIGSSGIPDGLPKTHEIGKPIRPILSTMNMFNEKVAKYFVPMLATLLSN